MNNVNSHKPTFLSIHITGSPAEAVIRLHILQEVFQRQMYVIHSH